MSSLATQGEMNGHKVKSHPAPESRVGDEGTSKRNITRKGGVKGKNGGGGGGQKGRWDPTEDGSEAQARDGIADKGDPNYDSEADEHDNNYVLVSDSTVIAPNGVSGPLHTLPEFKRHLKTIIEEYFLSEDISEVLRSVKELKSPAYHYEIVKRGINMSIDAKDHERELVSKLLSDAYPDILSSREVCKGFERLFEMIDDIQLDAPNARTLVASFLARAVADEIIPPSVLRNAAFLSLGGEIVKGARRLLSRDHVLSRLEHVWGPGDGRPVEELKVAIDQLLVEYLLSRQQDEAAACVKELDCSLFHHEIVKRAVKAALDKTDDDRTAMSSLLAYLNKNEVISDEQSKKGFDRLHEASQAKSTLKTGRILPDLVLDTPAAPSLLTKFTQQAISDGCLPADYKPPPTPSPSPAAENGKQGA
ncbi:unnamed protein product [Ectocarpus sp. 6 AP-2014]